MLVHSDDAINVSPYAIVPDFGSVNTQLYAGRVDALAVSQIELPLVPGASYDVFIQGSAGKVTTGVRATVVGHHDTVRVSEAEDGQLAPLVRDEGSARGAAAFEASQFNEWHSGFGIRLKLVSMASNPR